MASSLAGASELEQLMNEYRQQGAAMVSAAAGEKLWNSEFKDPGSGQPRSCAVCHGNDLTGAGKHVQTDKPIEPMAVSVNSRRLTEAKAIKKWLKRNCKWTLGRECTAQEKADVLTYINTR